MNSESCILAVIDPNSMTQRAFERGVHLAQTMDLPLELLVVVYDQFVEHDSKARDGLVVRSRDAAGELAKSARDRVESISVEARWGRPLADEVTKRAGEIDAALVIKETHHHSALRRTFLSNADWSLIRHCPSPLLLAKDRDLSARPQFLAAIDPAQEHNKPDSLDTAILALGKQLAEKLGGSLVPLHVLDSAMLTGTAPLATGTTGAYGAAAIAATRALPSAEVDKIREERKELIGLLLREAGIDEDDGVLLIGDPASTLVGTAERNDVDFVIMGAVARGVLDRILIGHTAEKILDRLPCDLIVVKPESAA
jgi:universal stress protein E